MKNTSNIIYCSLVVLALSILGCASSGGGQDILGTADSGLSTIEQSAQSGKQIMRSGAAVSQGVGGGQIGLTDTLTRQLGISQHQAMGGAGAIFQAAQGNMEPQAFSNLSQSVPGMNDMLGAAPAVSNPISGMTGGVSSMMGGSSNSLGSAASLAASFQQLNLSPDMIGQFVPIVTDYVKNSSGQAAASLLQSAIPIP